MASKKNKLCPYKKHCKDECYGENPCSFAKAFDGLQRKNDRLKAENEKLKNECIELNRRLDTLMNPDF